jgi:hypothetical protein
MWKERSPSGHDLEFVPRDAFRLRLDNATPNKVDFVLYCTSCEWIGETNAAHANSCRCPQCSNNVRIWKHTQKEQNHAKAYEGSH